MALGSCEQVRHHEAGQGGRQQIWAGTCFLPNLAGSRCGSLAVLLHVPRATQSGGSLCDVAVACDVRVCCRRRVLGLSSPVCARALGAAAEPHEALAPAARRAAGSCAPSAPAPELMCSLSSPAPCTKVGTSGGRPGLRGGSTTWSLRISLPRWSSRSRILAWWTIMALNQSSFTSGPGQRGHSQQGCAALAKASAMSSTCQSTTMMTICEPACTCAPHCLALELPTSPALCSAILHCRTAGHMGKRGLKGQGVSSSEPCLRHWQGSDAAEKAALSLNWSQQCACGDKRCQRTGLW
ncbi:uncharacterized protein C11orf94 homolog isoform X1 [Apteryx rowi]|uniref:uncharacterized protein C11orf94 homolog isoform X1 n=1 Tax=Apteryx rowi TaxID=308060 RepID=UPI000E1C4EF6|nr:uncharacterized protein C11orf94 homolog isoform X1 [Apteryx rowi]